MVSEGFPQIYSEIPLEYCTGVGNNQEMIAMFNPARRWSGPAPHEKLNSIACNMPRRCSMQSDTSQYLHAPANNLNMINPQSRPHCIQKPPLRHALSAPQQPMKMEHRLLPRPAIIQRPEVLPPVDTLEPIAAESPLYKTELCRPWEETGKCKYNSKCQYAHGVQELRHLNRHPKYKTELCRNFHKSAFCRYGPRCTFIHNDDERRGPSQTSPTSPTGLPAPAILPMSGSSTASSESSCSPSHSPSYLQDESFARFTPSPTFGSDGASIAGTVTPPSIKTEDSCSLELGLTQFQFAKMNIWMN